MKLKKITKKFFSLLLCAAMLLSFSPLLNFNIEADAAEGYTLGFCHYEVDDKIYFGSYPQKEETNVEYVKLTLDKCSPDDNDDVTVGENKYRKVTKPDGKVGYYLYQPIKWTVTASDDGGIEIMSDFILDQHDYAVKADESVTWENSDLRTWLNDEFFKTAFNDTEQKTIVLSHLDNKEPEKYNKFTGVDTDDKVYALGYADMDAAHGLGENNFRKTNGTDFAIARGLDKSQQRYWLRSRQAKDEAYSIYSEGNEVFVAKTNNTDAGIGCAPVIRLQEEYNMKLCDADRAVIENKVEATCVTDGHYDRVVYCTYCSRELSRETIQIKALGHDWGDGWHTEKEPTCTEKGLKKRVCARCGEFEEEDLPALGHDIPEWTVVTPASCTKEGIRKGHCERCDRDVTERLEPLGHDLKTRIEYLDGQKQATCTEAGSHTVIAKCTRCDYEEREIVTEPPLGHDWGNGWNPEKDPTCTEQGFRVKICERCGLKRALPIEPLGHDLEKIERVEATCTTAGNNEYYRCKRCGRYFKDTACKEETDPNSEIIFELGHEYDGWKNDKEQHWHYCTRCDQNVDLAAHEWKKEVLKQPTCTEDGKQRWTCLVCGYSYDEIIPALGHCVNKESDWTIITPATCTTEGLKSGHCTRCGKDVEVVIPALGHTPGETVTENMVEATCTEAGSYDEVEYCAKCDVELSRVTITVEALGHKLNLVDKVDAVKCVDENGNRNQGCRRGHEAYFECERCHKCFKAEPDNGTYVAAKDQDGNFIPTTPEAEAILVHTFKDTSEEYPMLNNYKDENGTVLGYKGEDDLVDSVHGGWYPIKDRKHPTSCVIESRCEKCGEVFRKTISVSGHDFTTDWTYVPATCKEDGYRYHYCQTCGLKKIDPTYTEMKNDNAHKWKDVEGADKDGWVVTVEPTCTQNGIEQRVCALCGKTQERSIKAPGHEYTRIAKVDPTCTECGTMAYYKCEVCGKYFVDGASGEKEERTLDQIENKISPLGHEFELVEAVVPSCTKDGSKAYFKCSRCGECFKAEMKDDGTYVPDKDGQNNFIQTEPEWEAEGAYGHDLQVVEEIPAKCTESGNNKYYKCVVCGACFKDKCGYTPTTEEAEVTAPLNHKLKEIPALEPTYTTDGNITYYVCERCGMLFKDAEGLEKTTLAEVTVGALGHVWSAWEIVKPATCSETGLMRMTCTVCHRVEELEIPIDPDAHVWSEWEVTEPTCTEKGSKTRVCTLCGKEETEEIPAPGHALTEIPAVAATCTEAGNNTYYKCETCGKYFKDAEGTLITTPEDELIEAAGHKLELIEAVEPTCTEDGNNAYYKCEVCGKYFKDAEGNEETNVENETINAIGHKGAKAVVENKVDPTCTELGAYDEVIYCENCGEELSRIKKEIPALGHDLKLVEAVAPTCTEAGHNAYYRCDRCGNAYFKDAEGTQITTPEAELLVAAGHKLELIGAVEPTCTAAGNNAYYKCSVCGKYFKDEKAEKETAPALEIVPALGHKGAAAEIENKLDATCTEDGSYEEVVRCSVCGEELSRIKKTISAAGHTLSVIPALAPTCTEDGHNAYYKCEICGKYFKDAEGKIETAAAAEKLTAIGHSYEWVVVRDATSTTEGEKIYRCANCGDIAQRESIPVKYINGDANIDGVITAADARVVLRAVVGLEQLTPTEMLAADVDFDNRITAADARSILRAAVGLERLASAIRDGADA